MNKVEHTGKVEGGRLIIHHRAAFIEDVQAFEGKRITITVEHVRSIRSGQQNRYYWGVIIPHMKLALRDAGYNVSELQATELHEFLKRRFLTVEIPNEETGEILSFTKSTTQLLVGEFADYISECVQFAAEFLHYAIPDTEQNPNFLTHNQQS